MAMPVRLFRVTPGAHTLRELLAPLVAGPGEVRLTAFDSSRLTLLRDIFGHLAHVEVCEFGQAVGIVLAERQGYAPMLPPKGLIEAALAEACRDLDEDSPFFRAKGYPGFHQVLARRWETLRSYRIDLPIIGEPVFQAKTQALAGIYSRAEQILNQLGRKFNADAMAACPEMEPEEPPFNRLILVAGSEFRPAEFDWLEWLAETGVQVDVVAEQHAGREPTGSLFGTEDKSAGLFAESERIEARFGPSRPFARANPLSECVFTDSDTKAVFDCEILETPDVLSECEWVLRRAHERADGAYGSVAIFCRSLESYGPILQAAADRLGVPLAMGRRFPLLATSIARAILDVLRACASSDVRDLSRLARSSYFPLKSLADRRIFEQACRLAYREGRNAWSSITDWAGDEGEGRPAWLKDLLEWRKIAVEEGATVEGWRERLIQLSLLPNLAGLSGESDASEVGLHARITKRDEHAVTAMLRSLAYDASVDRIGPRRQLSLGEFHRIARRLWEREEVSLEPEEVGVQVVHSAAAIGPVDTLFVMGMLEGEFPRRRQEDVLFTDTELLALSPEPRIPNSHDLARAERDEFYRACCAPARALILSYPRVDDDRDNVPAFYLEEIRKVTGVGDPVRFSRGRIVPEAPILASDAALKEAMDAAKSWPPAPALEIPAAQEFARGEQTAFKPRELADAYQCPFRFFASYRLDVHPSHERMHWGGLSGLPRRARLAAMSDPEVAAGKLREAVDDHLGNMIAETLPHDYKLMQAGAHRLIEDWVSREFRAQAVWPRETIHTEDVGFEFGPMRNRIKLRDGRFVQLSGDVPAVSIRGDMEVIHLFRGSDPIADPGVEGDARFHPNEMLEMGIYLLMRSDRDRPAGVEIDHGRGRRLITIGASQFPRQDIRSEMRSTSFESHERSELLAGMVERIQIAVERIESGEITPTPEEQRCHFCDFGELCRRSYRFSEVDEDPFQEEEDGIFAD